MNFLFVPNVKSIIFGCPKIWAHYSLIVMCSNIGAPKNHYLFFQILGHLKIINFPFGTNGKLMVLGVPIFKHIYTICLTSPWQLPPYNSRFYAIPLVVIVERLYYTRLLTLIHKIYNLHCHLIINLTYCKNYRNLIR